MSTQRPNCALVSAPVAVFIEVMVALVAGGKAEGVEPFSMLVEVHFAFRCIFPCSFWFQMFNLWEARRRKETNQTARFLPFFCRRLHTQPLWVATPSCLFSAPCLWFSLKLLWLWSPGVRREAWNRSRCWWCHSSLRSSSTRTRSAKGWTTSR